MRGDAPLRLSISSYLILTKINTFGYNPQKIQYYTNVHFDKLQDFEVLKDLNLDHKDQDRSLDISNLEDKSRKSIKNEVYLNVLLPFFGQFLQQHISTYMI